MYPCPSHNSNVQFHELPLQTVTPVINMTVATGMIIKLLATDCHKIIQSVAFTHSTHSPDASGLVPTAEDMKIETSSTGSALSTS